MSFLATGYESITLFRNNKEVRVWPNDKNPTLDGSSDPFSDSPSITSVYRLEGKYHPVGSPAKELKDTLSRTVQVMSPGWNALVLPQGSPVRLFVANDFSGSGRDRLYGIFFQAESGNYALYSSETGVNDWREEAGEVPHHLATSPGVYYKDKLWLIGGSAIDPALVYDEVWYMKRTSIPKFVPGITLPSTPCHRQCRRAWAKPVSSFRGNWTMGASKKNCGSSVVMMGMERRMVTYGDSRKNYQRIQRIQRISCGIACRNLSGAHASIMPPPRSRLHAVMKLDLRRLQTPRRRVLMTFALTCGGRLMEQPGHKWQCMTHLTRTRRSCQNPGLPLGAALAAYPQAVPPSGKVEPDRAFLIGSFKEWAAGASDKPVVGAQASRPTGNRISSFIFEWHEGSSLWEAGSVFNAWQQFHGDTYCMQAVAFNQFLFVLSLQSPIEAALKLNILMM